MNNSEMFKRWKVRMVNDPLGGGFANENETMGIISDGNGGATLSPSSDFCDPEQFKWSELSLNWTTNNGTPVLVGRLPTDDENVDYSVEMHTVIDSQFKGGVKLVCQLYSPEGDKPRGGTWNGEED